MLLLAVSIGMAGRKQNMHGGSGVQQQGVRRAVEDGRHWHYCFSVREAPDALGVGHGPLWLAVDGVPPRLDYWAALFDTG